MSEVYCSTGGDVFVSTASLVLSLSYCFSSSSFLSTVFYALFCTLEVSDESVVVSLSVVSSLLLEDGKAIWIGAEAAGFSTGGFCSFRVVVLFDLTFAATSSSGDVK